MKHEAYRLMEELDESYWWYQARREIVCDALVRFLPARGDVVDYGSGAGATAARLRDLGYRVIAADVNDDMLQACRRRGLPTVNLGERPIPPASADGVLACDVLEHVEDDVGLLKSLRDALRPGGLLVGTVPAYELLWSGEDFVSGHLRRYTRRSLRASLGDAGYEVVWASYFNTLLFPLASLVIMSKRLFRPRAMYRSNVEPLPARQNALLRAVFERERWLLRRVRLPFGLSVIFVARPPREGADVI
jgi:SAM-dependent methyltransferase